MFLIALVCVFSDSNNITKDIRDVLNCNHILGQSIREFKILSEFDGEIFFTSTSNKALTPSK